MPDPITMAIATAIAGRTADVLTDQAKHALSEITRRLRDKFQHRPADLAALAAAQSTPHSPEQISALAAALDRATAEDPEFGQAIRNLWTQVNIEATTSGQSVTNVFNGTAGKVIQARDIHGNLNIS